MTTELGDLATWVGAFGTISAFVATYALLRREADRDRRASEAEAMRHARRVSAWVDEHSNIIVQNFGDEPIYDVNVTLGTGDKMTEQEASRRTLCFGMVAPGRREEGGISNFGPNVSCVPEFAHLTLAFRDADQREWLRLPNGILLPKPGNA